MGKKISYALSFSLTILLTKVFAAPGSFPQANALNTLIYKEKPYSQISRDDYIPRRIVNEIDPMGLCIRTEDGTVWTVKDEQSRRNLMYWRIYDSVVIHPCWSPYWSGGAFFLENERTETTVVVDLSLPSQEFTETSAFLLSINSFAEEIIVMDAFERRFKFFPAPADFSIYSSWMPGDQIILGSGENWYSGIFFPYIIINTRTREFVRVSMY